MTPGGRHRALSATPRLISREAELELLRSAVARAAAGQATAALVAGDAGVGKSRLVAELAARTGDALVLVGHCVELGDGELPFAPVIGALRTLPSRLEAGELDRALGPARAELARLIPALGEADAPEAFGKARLLESILGMLGRLGQARPVLVVIEDLHWADGSTRDLLRFLVRSATDERLALVATYRTDDVSRSHPLRPYVVELARDPRVLRVELEPFSRDAFSDHVAAILGGLPAPAELDRLFERSEGNPFFTEELLAAGAGPLPASVRDAILLRLERLSPSTQHVLRVLAVAGRRVDHRLLAAATGLSDDALAEAVREAADAHVLTPAGEGYELRHALLREALYGEVLAPERRRLHATVAAELEARPDLSAGALQAELAHHWHAAGDVERAFAASIRAGEEAERVFAHPEALRHYQRALELRERVVSAVDRVELTEAAAAAASAAGEHELAIALTRRAIELGGAAGRLHGQLAQCLWDAGRGTEALPVSARAVALAPTEPTRERALVLESHARLLALTGRALEARPPIDEAIAIARERGDLDVEAAALATRVIVQQGHAEAALAAGREALAAAQRSGELGTMLRAYVNAAEAFDHAGRVQEAIDLGREGVEAARSGGTGYLKSGIAGQLAKLGRLDEAAAFAADALRTVPPGAGAVGLHHAVAAIAAVRGDAAAVESAAALAEASALESGGGQSSARGTAAVAELALWQGDAERALAVVDAALEGLAGAEYVWYSAPLYALGARAHADRALREQALGRDAAADREAMLALGARLDAQLGADAPPEPVAYRAQVAAELGRLDAQAEPWAAAGRQWETLGFPLHRALCAWREADALLAADGDRGRATDLLVAAHRTALDLRARPLAAEIEGLARRARIALSGVDRGTADETGLSPRELDVLALIVEGRTNREIASELFISEKTVSVHVSRVLAKLGVANRAQAATVAHRIGLARVPE